MNRSAYYLAVAISLGLAAFCALAENGDVCDRLKNEKSPAAYLIDKNGNIDSGPIDFGKYIFALNEAVDYIYIPTTYRVIITPKRIVVDGILSGGSFELKPARSLCPNSNTYELSYAIRGFPTIIPEMLPRKENNEGAQLPLLHDPKNTWFSNHDLIIRFDNGFFGEIMDGREYEQK